MKAYLLKKSLTGLAGIGLLVAARRLLRPHFSFRGRVIVITGGSRGLGLCLARQFGKQGARLVLLARDAGELERAAQQLRSRGVVVHTFAADVRQESTAERVIAEARETFGRVDVLVNNAGIISVAPLTSTTEADFANAMATHFWAPLKMMRAALPELRKTQGRIVNISSIGGVVAVPHLAAYSASKFALGGLSDAFRSELAVEGIKVTTVYPGLMRTGSHIQAKFRGNHEKEFGWFALACATPLTSMNADRAARKIVAACRRGAPRLVLSIQAKILHLANTLLPDCSAAVAAFVCRWLPKPASATPDVKGGDVHDAFPFTWMTALAEKASAENNELRSS